MKNNKVIVVLVFILLIAIILCTFLFKKINNGKPTPASSIPEKPRPSVIIPQVTNTGNFTIDFLKRINKEENFLISPYSIEIALSMLKSGADGETKEEIDKLVPSRDLSLNNEYVKISNALFVKNMYKPVIEKGFENELKNRYNSTLLYGEFKTPKVINDWVKESTDGMIDKILDSIDPDFVLGLANAIAIDAKWSSQFECENTQSQKFIKSNNIEMNTEMMHKQYSYDIKYLNDDNIKGVIIPYKENLEFVALLPKESLKEYINNLTKEDLDKSLDSFKTLKENERLNLSLPRFKYNYNVTNFINILNDMGIKSAFDPLNADFSKIITKENLSKLGKDSLYVSDGMHKTYIDLNEKGTKAAAVTYFGVRAGSAHIDDFKIIDIKFNKPFMYIIRDTKTNEILFMGGVYEPNKWSGTTCSNEKD